MTIDQTLSPEIPLPPLRRVAVIGTGASGLAALAQLVDNGIEPVAYEAREKPGGVWNYEREAGECQLVRWDEGSPVLRTEQEIADGGVNGPSAVYDGLKTNLPAEAMTFHDFPHPPGTEIFPSYERIAQYLHRYAKVKGLLPYIEFSTLVRSVYKREGEDWTIVTEQNGVRRDDKFSHIIVANGHFNDPYIPNIPGLKSWTGKIAHSRWWRNPSAYKDQNVLVVGSHASGSDIARELVLDLDQQAGARKVYQSVRPKDEAADKEEQEKAGEEEDTGLYDGQNWQDLVDIVTEIDRVDGEVIHLKDGTQVRGVDTILFATGYLYSYPFFSPEQAPFDKNPLVRSSTSYERQLPLGSANRPINLDGTDTFYAPDPTLSFVGLHRMINPFPLGELSARLIVHSYINQLIPALPPLLRNSPTPGDMNIGYPQEFENQDNWLRAIALARAKGLEAHGAAEEHENALEEGLDKYKVPQHLRELRGNAVKMRKAHLGY